MYIRVYETKIGDALRSQLSLPALEGVLGKDERTLVADTLKIPNRWICAIDILVDNPKWGRLGEPKFISRSRATGILIGPRYVLTVAHIRKKQCIEIDGKTKLVDVKGFTVSPARDGDNNPFGKVTAKSFLVSQPYKILKKMIVGSKVREIPVTQIDDYALIILKKDVTHSKMKGELGYWGHRPAETVILRLEPDDLSGKEVVVIGYPGDTCGKDKFSGSKAEKERKISYCWHRRNDEWASTQWRSAGTLQVEKNSTRVFHTADTYWGQSGAPICLWFDKKLA
ncbi:MAG: trypsin-like serine peptidase, partial [Candidatus Binatia bacterium]